MVPLWSNPPPLNLLQSYQCQLNFVTTQLSSTKGKPFVSEWSGPQQFTPDSALKCCGEVRSSGRNFSKPSLSHLPSFFLLSVYKASRRQRGRWSRALKCPASLFSSLLPSPPVSVTEACSAGMWIISRGAPQHQKLGEPLRIQMWGLMVHFINVLPIKAHFTDLGDWLIYTLWEIASSHA